VEPSGLKVDRSLIAKIEEGRIPNWPLLAAFAIIYQIPLPELLSVLIQNIEFPGSAKLLRDACGSDTKKALPQRRTGRKGHADVAPFVISPSRASHTGVTKKDGPVSSTELRDLLKAVLREFFDLNRRMDQHAPSASADTPTGTRVAQQPEHSASPRTRDRRTPPRRRANGGH